MYDQILRLAASVHPGGDHQFSQFVIDIVEEMEGEGSCANGLKQPHLTTHDGRLSVWAMAADLKAMLDAVEFKDKNEQAFMEQMRDLFVQWGDALMELFYIDGGERPPQAVKPRPASKRA